MIRPTRQKAILLAVLVTLLITALVAATKIAGAVRAAMFITGVGSAVAISRVIVTNRQINGARKIALRA